VLHVEYDEVEAGEADHLDDLDRRDHRERAEQLRAGLQPLPQRGATASGAFDS
jgi:hypothetical protein